MPYKNLMQRLPGLVCRWLSPSPDIVLTVPEFDFLDRLAAWVAASEVSRGR